MACFLLAGQNVCYNYQVPGLEPFETNGTKLVDGWSPVPNAQVLTCCTLGWVGGEQRRVECWSAPPGILLKVAGGCDVYIESGSRSILRINGTKEYVDLSNNDSPSLVTSLDKEILAGPALVLALALRGVWCLHGSAALFQDKLTAFLGESGQGKSTLAAYLAANGGPEWRLVADDILPVSTGSVGVTAWPHFPQLKLSLQEQPGPGLPEQLRLDRICVLSQPDKDQMPELQSLPPGQAVQMILRHTAGTRLYDPDLLAKHLSFCAQAAGKVPVYRLVYPHRREALPIINELLESLC